MRDRGRSRLAALVLAAVLLLLIASHAAAPPPTGEIRVNSDLELLGIGSVSGGGRMTWTLTGEQASTLRQKIIGFFDETYRVSVPFPNMPLEYVVHPLFDPVRNNGILEEKEASIYADFLARYLTGAGQGFDYRYTRLTAANRLQQGLDIALSSSGLVNSRNSTTDPLELRFWFNAATNPPELWTNLSETRFADALHEVFSFRHNQNFGGGLYWPLTRPFDIRAGDAFWVDATGNCQAGQCFLAHSNRATGSYNASSTVYAQTSTRPSFEDPLDLRFATEGTIAVDYSADVVSGDTFKIEVCRLALYGPLAGGCAGAWKTLVGDAITGSDITARRRATFDLDAPANNLLGDRWTVRLNFTSAATTVTKPGVHIYRFMIDAPSHASGTIVSNHADLLVGTSDLNNWGLTQGNANYIRTPAGVVGFYSNTFDRDAQVGDSVRYQAFDFFENQQLLFALVVVAAYVQAYFMDRFYLEHKARYPIRYRLNVTRLSWLTWLGRLFIIFMILWYFFPGMFAVFGVRVIIPGIVLWGYSLGAMAAMIVLTRFVYERQLQKAIAGGMSLAPTLEEKAQVCSHCFDAITSPRDRYICACGEPYHGHCATKLTSCASCGRPVQVSASAAPAVVVAMVEVICPSCGVPNKAAPAADLALERCVACAAPLKALDRGFNYLILAATPEPAFRWFNGLLAQGVTGLILSTTFPEKLRKEYALPNAEIFWISDTTPAPKILDPRRLDFEIMRAFSNFVKANRGGAVMLHGAEYLVVENSFDKVFKFLKKVNDLCGPYEITLLVPLTPNSLEPEQMGILMKEFDRIEQLVDAPPAPSGAPPPPPPPA